MGTRRVPPAPRDSHALANFAHSVAPNQIQECTSAQAPFPNIHPGVGVTCATAFCVAPVSHFTAAPQSHGGNTVRPAVAVCRHRPNRFRLGECPFSHSLIGQSFCQSFSAGARGGPPVGAQVTVQRRKLSLQGTW